MIPEVKLYRVGDKDLVLDSFVFVKDFGEDADQDPRNPDNRIYVKVKPSEVLLEVKNHGFIFTSAETFISIGGERLNFSFICDNSLVILVPEKSLGGDLIIGTNYSSVEIPTKSLTML